MLTICVRNDYHHVGRRLHLHVTTPFLIVKTKRE
nr:MAG TPA: hypothetical protein [Caudoviricetes sp.]